MLLLLYHIGQNEIFQWSTTCQHVSKGNVVSFAQDFESAIKLLDTLPLSLESLFNIILKHFVGSSHPFIEY